MRARVANTHWLLVYTAETVRSIVISTAVQGGMENLINNSSAAQKVLHPAKVADTFNSSHLLS